MTETALAGLAHVGTGGVPDQYGGAHGFGGHSRYSATGGDDWTKNRLAGYGPSRYYDSMFLDLSRPGAYVPVTTAAGQFTEDMLGNPGLPPIKVERFIDEYRSRNERMADLMRRLGLCEEKGSGVDKVVSAAEAYQLPAPDFRVGELRTTAVLFAHQEFPAMTKADRVRACYQHCCLQYVTGQRMSNQSLRQRFGLSESKAATVSLVIGATKDAGLIKADDSETLSSRYARYLPFWA